MAPMVDTEFALLDDYRALNVVERRRRVEREGRFFIVEGRIALEALLDSPYRVRSILVAEHKEAAVRRLVARAAPVSVVARPDAAEPIPVVVRPAAELAEVAGFDFHRGVLASADRRPLPPVGEVVAAARTLAVLEGVNDHENLGALFRNAAAFGLDAVLLDPATADPLYRRSVRVSAGHVLRMPWTRLAPWPAGLADLRDAGYEVIALTPDASAEPIDATDRWVADRREAASGADAAPRLAIVVGAEGPGLSDAALAAASRRVRIPIEPGVDSLNVATAAAVAFHRLAPGPPDQ
jgi:tRNA G18 (ribose-2'-O)-methylase SpoU